jgi:hypothetical protein
MLQQTANIVNGVNVNQLVGTIEAVKANPALARCKFRAETEWVSGGHSRTKASYTLTQREIPLWNNC